MRATKAGNARGLGFRVQGLGEHQKQGEHLSLRCFKDYFGLRNGLGKSCSLWGLQVFGFRVYGFVLEGFWCRDRKLRASVSKVKAGDLQAS